MDSWRRQETTAGPGPASTGAISCIQKAFLLPEAASYRYWHFLVITLAVLTFVSTVIYAVVLESTYKVERIIGLSLTILAVSSLLCTAFHDPGIFPRYSKPLAPNWTYSEYAQSYRPPGVIYCQQCQLLIEDYNRAVPEPQVPELPDAYCDADFCPWSGIVIGKGNEAYFQVGLSFVPIATSVFAGVHNVHRHRAYL